MGSITRNSSIPFLNDESSCSDENNDDNVQIIPPRIPRTVKSGFDFDKNHKQLSPIKEEEHIEHVLFPKVILRSHHLQINKLVIKSK